MPMHELILLHYPVGPTRPGFDDPRYDEIKAHPPNGCSPEDFESVFGLRCRRSAPTLLDAVAAVCAEANAAYGIQLNDLGIEKLWEWAPDGRDGFGALVVGQLLLMAAHRGELLGYSVDDLTRFLHAATASPRA
jgi:hypothetical protein